MGSPGRGHEAVPDTGTSSCGGPACLQDGAWGTGSGTCRVRVCGISTREAGVLGPFSSQLMLRSVKAGASVSGSFLGEQLPL